MLAARRAIVAPLQTGIECAHSIFPVALLECVQVARHVRLVLPVKNTDREIRLGEGHKLLLKPQFPDILRGNRVFQRLAGRNFAVRLIGHRKRDGSRCGIGARHGLIHCAFVAIEYHVVGRCAVFHIEILAVDAQCRCARHLQIARQAVFVGNIIGAEVLHIFIGESRIDFLLQLGLIGGNLFRVALDDNVEIGGAAYAVGTARNKLHRGGERDRTIGGSSIHLACVVAVAVAAHENPIGIGACPRDLEFIIRARAIRQRQVARHAAGVVARCIADRDALGGFVKQVLESGFIPRDRDGLVRLVVLGLAIARELKSNVRIAQLVDRPAGVFVRVDEEERDLAVGGVLRIRNADRRFFVGPRERNAALCDLHVDIGIPKFRQLGLKGGVDVRAIGAIGNLKMHVGIVELLHCRSKRILA